jgi:hypothetical protein
VRIRVAPKEKGPLARWTLQKMIADHFERLLMVLGRQQVVTGME